MSMALYNEIKRIREQILDLVRRVESLEETRLEARKKREILTMPVKPEAPGVAEWARKNPHKVEKNA